MHFGFLIPSLISSCPGMFVFLFTLVLVVFAPLSRLKVSLGNMQFAQLLKVPAFHHLPVMDPTPIGIFV